DGAARRRTAIDLVPGGDAVGPAALAGVGARLAHAIAAAVEGPDLRHREVARIVGGRPGCIGQALPYGETVHGGAAADEPARLQVGQLSRIQPTGAGSDTLSAGPEGVDASARAVGIVAEHVAAEHAGGSGVGDSVVDGVLPGGRAVDHAVSQRHCSAQANQYE